MSSFQVLKRQGKADYSRLASCDQELGLSPLLRKSRPVLFVAIYREKFAAMPPYKMLYG